MTKPNIAFERSILATEKDVLDAKKEALYEVFPDLPLFCRAIEDSQNQRWFQVLPFYPVENRNEILAQIKVDELARIDLATFQKRLSAGEFAAK